VVVACGLFAACVVLVVHFQLTRVRPKPPPPPTFTERVVADDVGALDEVVLHYVPELEPVFAATYTDFLRTLPPATRVDLVVQKGRRAALEAFLGGVPFSGAHIVEIDVALGIWSKDRALVLGEGAERLLLVPPRPRAGEATTSSRPLDWPIVPAFARAMPDRGFQVKELPLAFDAGDLAIAGKTVVFDANLLARNRARGIATDAALLERMRGLVGRDVVMLGNVEGDVPRHHMSMYMAPLPNRTALVGDPSLAAAIVGRTFVPGEVSVETGQPLVADFSPETQARFDRAARDLVRAGFRVVRIPNVPFDDKTYLSYTNGVYETRDGRRIAWVPKLGVPDLDRAAFAVYEGEGFTVHPVDVRKVYPHHGTLGCLVNVLARR